MHALKNQRTLVKRTSQLINGHYVKIFDRENAPCLIHDTRLFQMNG